MATQYYEALSQSQLKITKEVTINTAIDFTDAGCPRLGTITYKCNSIGSLVYKYSSSTSNLNPTNEKRFCLMPIYGHTTFYFLSCLKKQTMSSYNSVNDGRGYYNNSTSASRISTGFVTDGVSTSYSYNCAIKPEIEMTSVELDGKTYWGYKSSYYAVAPKGLLNAYSNNAGSSYSYVILKGKVTVVIYKASSQTIDTMEYTFNGYDASDGYVDNSLSYSYSAIPCLVIPKEDDDLVLGIFVEDVE